jgi:hypothetical protein
MDGTFTTEGIFTQVQINRAIKHGATVKTNYLHTRLIFKDQATYTAWAEEGEQPMQFRKEPKEPEWKNESVRRDSP